jgi:hypothetical protein
MIQDRSMQVGIKKILAYMDTIVSKCESDSVVDDSQVDLEDYLKPD